MEGAGVGSTWKVDPAGELPLWSVLRESSGKRYPGYTC